MQDQFSRDPPLFSKPKGICLMILLYDVDVTKRTQSDQRHPLLQLPRLPMIVLHCHRNRDHHPVTRH
jgi:hypothetical protein